MRRRDKGLLECAMAVHLLERRDQGNVDRAGEGGRSRNSAGDGVALICVKDAALSPQGGEARTAQSLDLLLDLQTALQLVVCSWELAACFSALERGANPQRPARRSASRTRSLQILTDLVQSHRPGRPNLGAKI